MIDNKKWLKFELRADIDKREHFEIGFCREFFKISQGLASLDDVQIIEGLPGIENTPINGIAFQSKYLNNWNWTQIKESLEKVRDTHKEYFPDLKKVIVYVKSIDSKAYLKNKNDSNGIIQELSRLNIEVDIYDGWEKIWEDDIYESLRQYFIIPEDVGSRLALVKKYTDNLLLDTAADILSDILEKFDGLTDQHKYEATFYRGKIQENRNRYKEHSKSDDTSYYNDYITAAKYVNHTKSKILCSVGYLCTGKIEEALKLADEVLKIEPNNENAFGVKLYCLDDALKDFDAILKHVSPSFLQNPHILGVLGSIGQKYIGTIKSFEKFRSKSEYLTYENLVDKISYALIWSQYLDEKYSRKSVDSHGRESYIALSEFLSSIASEIYGKELDSEVEILNALAIIHSKIFRDFEEAEFYYQKILENHDLGIIKLNRALNLLHSSGIGDDKVIEALEELTNKLDFYLDKESKNPNKDVLFQAPILLAQEYKYLGEKNGEYLQKAIKTLEDFKNKYYDSLDPSYKKNFHIADIQIDKAASLEKALEYIQQDPSIDSYLLAFHASGDEEYIESAYALYLEGEEENLEPILNLAMAYFTDERDHTKYFEILYENIRDYSNLESLNRLISVGINLGKVQEITKILDENIKIQGVSDDAIYFLSILESKKGETQKALDIIVGHLPSDKNTELLYCRSHLEYRLGNPNYTTTLLRLYDIFEEKGFKNISPKEIRNFLNCFATINIRRCAEIAYDFIQDSNISESDQKELRRLFFSFMLGSEKEELFFDPSSVNKNSVLHLKNTKNNEISIIVGDGISSKEFGFKRIFSETDFKRFLNGEVGQSYEDVFGNMMGIIQTYEIINIECKYLYLFRQMFSYGLEDSIGGIRISVPTIEGKTDFSQFFEINQTISDQNRENEEFIKENYEKKGILTFGILKHCTGHNYLEIYYQDKYQVLLSDLRCDMNDWEDIENLMLDPSSIISIQELGIEKIIPGKFNLFVTQSTLSHFQNLLQEVENSPKAEMGISTSSKGEISRVEYGEDYHTSYRAKLEQIVSWILQNTTIKGADILAQDDREYDKVFGRAFNDSLAVASENHYALYTDDHVVRLFSQKGENVLKAFGSEHFLKYLTHKKIIYPDLLCDSYVKLCELGFQGITITTELMNYYILKSKFEGIDRIVEYISKEKQNLEFLVGVIIHSIISFENILNSGILIHNPHVSRHDYIRISVNSFIKTIEKYYDSSEVQQKIEEIIKLQSPENQSLIRGVLFAL